MGIIPWIFVSQRCVEGFLPLRMESRPSYKGSRPPYKGSRLPYKGVTTGDSLSLSQEAGTVGIIPWIFVSQRCVEGLFFWTHLAVSQVPLRIRILVY